MGRLGGLMDFKIATADLGNAVFTVSVAGEVDLATAPELKEALAEVVNSGARGVLVDLSNATFIDSTTLGVLMGAVKRLRPAGGELAIACHDSNIRKIFEITLLDRVFQIFETPGAGVEYLQELGAPARDVSSLG
jgi:anti-sigma B factor antagonist